MTNNDLNSGNWNQPDENIEKGTLPIISDSWIRCSDYGLDASGKPEEPVLSEKNSGVFWNTTKASGGL